MTLPTADPTAAPFLTLDQIAQVVHEANRTLQRLQAAPGIPDAGPWHSFPDAEKDGVRSGVRLALTGATPEALHENWVREKIDAGWVYGPTKSATHKTHPCLVPYHDLPEQQKAKDRLLGAIAGALGA